MKKNILIGVAGGIASYKTCELVRLLVKAGYKVKVLMTKNAKQFIHPNTFAALTENAVYDDLFADPMLHIELAKWADQFVIAPATASVVSKLATGAADDLLTTIALASTAKPIVVPAMNKVMWDHPATQANLKKLQEYACQILMPAYGVQACGDVGFGRMLEPEQIFSSINVEKMLLKNIRVLITAGPTQEHIDPIRYLSNSSSGRMGYALAEACQNLGAKVTLISGPSALEAPNNCELIKVTSAEEMLGAVKNNIQQQDIFISAAAVADYQCQHVATEKLKKADSSLRLELVRTPDILQSIADTHSVFKVGFCAESSDLINRAKQKLNKKKLQAIVANQILKGASPFAAAMNEVSYVDAAGQVTHFEKQEKFQLAQRLIPLILKGYQKFQPLMAAL